MTSKKIIQPKAIKMKTMVVAPLRVILFELINDHNKNIQVFFFAARLINTSVVSRAIF